MRPGASALPAVVRAAWGIPADGDVVPVGRGHINHSLRVTGAAGPLLLQRLNGEVFPSPEVVLRNLERLLAEPAVAATTPLRLVPPMQGAVPWVSAADGFWRAFRWLPEVVAFDGPPNAVIAARAGAALGRCTAALGSLEAGSIAVPILGFHDARIRDEALGSARRLAPPSRLRAAAPLLERQERLRALHLHRWLGDRSRWPQRVTHNDAKLDNVLFDARARVLGVVDLDTVMPADLWVEVGDLLRALAWPGAEDAPVRRARPALVPVLAALDPFLEAVWARRPPEADPGTLGTAPAYLAWLLGTRFLTDFLDGDRVFPARDAQQNLRRASVQLDLAEGFVEVANVLVRYIRRAARARLARRVRDARKLRGPTA